GQEEVEVVRVADTVCLVTVPGLGDDIQAIKAGVLEIADVLVVNKADRPGADETARDLAQMLTLGAPRTAWKAPIIRTVAATGEGTDQLIAAIAKHRAWAAESGERDARRRAAARAEVEDLLRDSLVRRLRDRLGQERVERAIARVAGIVLAVVFGYSLTFVPLLRGGMALGQAIGVTAAADTISIVVMESVDNLIVVLVPGAMSAGLGDALFWGSLALGLVLAFAVAFPVTRWLLARRRGH